MERRNLTEQFMSIHEKPSTRLNKNLSKVYEMLDKYGTKHEDVDKVFNRATLKERLEMVKLLKEGAEDSFDLENVREKCQEQLDSIIKAVKVNFKNIDFDFSAMDASKAGGRGIRTYFEVIRPVELTRKEYTELLEEIKIFIKQNFKKTYPHVRNNFIDLTVS